ncbi:MAG: recombination-associated protein RdgC [Zetaproteobacteria bacterium]|nr:MAG: recombination-associated protein RdgC [Zetaproteobacteria bacterium]
MWFRNIHFYRFEEPFKYTAEQLDQALAQRKARPCGQLEPACEGWSRPLGLDGQMLVHDTDGRLMVCLRREDKVLPPSLMREQLAAKVFEIEQETGRKVGRRERAELREQLLRELLPRALVKASHTWAYIDGRAGWLVVNAASAKKSEELIALLRRCVGQLPVVVPQPAVSPESAMTRWLLDEPSLPPDFMIEDACELRAADKNGAVIRCQHVDMDSDEVRAHVLAGRSVYKLAMRWRERVSFVLHDDLSLRRIRFDSELVDQAAAEATDARTQFDADFAIMGAELGELIPALLGAMDALG